MTKLNFHITVPDSLNERLLEISNYLRRSKSSIMKEALEDFVCEIEQERKEYPEIKKILRSNNPSISLEEAMKELGLRCVEN